MQTLHAPRRPENVAKCVFFLMRRLKSPPDLLSAASVLGWPGNGPRLVTCANTFDPLKRAVRRITWASCSDCCESSWIKRWRFDHSSMVLFQIHAGGLWRHSDITVQILLDLIMYWRYATRVAWSLWMWACGDRLHPPPHRTSGDWQWMDDQRLIDTQKLNPQFPSYRVRRNLTPSLISQTLFHMFLTPTLQSTFLWFPQRLCASRPGVNRLKAAEVKHLCCSHFFFLEDFREHFSWPSSCDRMCVFWLICRQERSSEESGGPSSRGTQIQRGHSESSKVLKCCEIIICVHRIKKQHRAGSQRDASNEKTSRRDSWFVSVGGVSPGSRIRTQMRIGRKFTPCLLTSDLSQHR